MNRLERAVENMAYVLLGIDTGDVWQRFSCSEIEAIADVLTEAGHKDAAAFILGEHAEHDEPGDEHHIDRPQFEIVAQFHEGIKRCGEIRSFPSRQLAEAQIAHWNEIRPELNSPWWVREIKEEQVNV